MSNQHCSQTGNGSDPVRPTFGFQPDGSGVESTAFPRPLAPTGGSLGGKDAATSLHQRLVWDALYTSTRRQVKHKISVLALSFSKSRKSVDLEGNAGFVFSLFRAMKYKTGLAVMFFLCISMVRDLRFA